MGHRIHYGDINMKIRYPAAIFTLLILIAMAYFWTETSADEQVAVDMVYYNKELQEISRAVGDGDEKSEIETAFDCSLYLIGEEDYKAKVNDAIVNGYVVLDYEEDGAVKGKVVWDREIRRTAEWKQQFRKSVMITCVAILFVGYLLLMFLYMRFVRPFDKLGRFAGEIAKGNLDLPLPMEKHNFFGAFTESFDIMREELKKAREKEYQANVSKKELVAELSHDIKTPVAAIKATCEVLEIKEKNPETLEKVKVIESKADTIDHLIGNMFHATMEELSMLKVEVTEESSLVIPEMFSQLKFYGDIRMKNEIPECLLSMDKLRLTQVIDNIVNNSFKYAKTQVEVSFAERESGVTIEIRDRGAGVSEEELVLITEKYYRGSNASGVSGSGLGLYLASSFMEQMKGSMECHNDGGFVVMLFLQKV